VPQANACTALTAVPQRPAPCGRARPDEPDLANGPAFQQTLNPRAMLAIVRVGVRAGGSSLPGRQMPPRPQCFPAARSMRTSRPCTYARPNSLLVVMQPGAVSTHANRSPPSHGYFHRDHVVDQDLEL